VFTYFVDPRRYNAHTVSVTKPKEENILAAKIMLIPILEKSGVSVENGLNWLSIGSSGISYEHENESSGSITNREFLDYQHDYQLLNCFTSRRDTVRI
jgi:hypothetical protein